VPEADVFAWMRPFPGERVLWQGAAAVGASWPPVPRLLRNALVCWLTPVAMVLLIGFLLNVGKPPLPGEPSRWSELLGSTSRLALVVGVIVAFILVTILVSKVAGPSYLTIALVLLTTPAFARSWADLVRSHGWGGALEHAGPLLLQGAIVLGLPLALFALRLITRLDTIYVITDRRVAAVLGSRHVTLWERSRDTAWLRAEHDWPSSRTGAHLVVSTPHRTRKLYLRDDDPVAVVEQVRRTGVGT
jgi:hypothetical protein